MSLTYQIPTRFTATENVSGVVKNMERNISAATERANVSIARQERLFRRLTPGLGHAAKQLLGYAGAGAAIGAVAFSGKAILDYETAIQSLQAVTGVSNEELTGFKKEITSLATQSKKTATDVAGSFEVIGSAMSEYLTDPKALRQISEAGITLSKASRTELVPTLENLTSIMNQFNLTAGQADNTIQRLTAGEIVGSLRTAQVAESLKMFGANAQTANVSLGESVALVEALAKQRPAENLGIDSRNLLIVLDAAKALDKKARASLRKSGVDMDFLSDKSHSLSQRLHELKKIENDNIGMIHVFGERNVTAAKVIFNQLDTYDQYAQKIATTNQAQVQAATNSNTLAQSVERLKNTWINYVTTSDSVAVGIEKLKSGVSFLTNNLDTIVSTGINVIKFFAVWKAAILVAKAVTIGMNIVMGVQNVLQLQSTALIEGNIIAQKAAAITERALAAAIAIQTGNWAALNAVMIANPITAIIVGTAALVVGIGYLIDKQAQLRAEYEAGLNGRIEKAQNDEIARLDKMIDRNVALGMSRKQAAMASIEAERTEIAIQFSRNAVEIKTLQSKLEEKQLNLGVYGRYELPGAGAIHDELLPKMKEQTSLAERNRALTDYTINKAKTAAPAASQTFSESDKFTQSELAQTVKKQGPDMAAQIDYNLMKRAFSDALKEQKQNINVNVVSGYGDSAKSVNPNSY